MVVHAFNPSIQQAEAGRSLRVPGPLTYIVRSKPVRVTCKTMSRSKIAEAGEMP